MCAIGDAYFYGNDGDILILDHDDDEDDEEVLYIL